MNRRLHWTLAMVMLVLPSVAHAHEIHPLWVVAALSPLAVLPLTALLGWFRRSLRVALIHAGLIVVWVALFWLASNLVTHDYLIWAPLALYVLHAILLIALVGWHVFDRSRSKGRVA
jgi:type III secretory pathway component EscT